MSSPDVKAGAVETFILLGSLPLSRHRLWVRMTGLPDVTHGRPPRWEALDFWRGYFLCTIFINHVPGNAFEPLTQKNFGFSDSAEGFVFLSGISLALAFGRRWAGGEWWPVTRSLVQRSARLYGMHILLSLMGLAIFAAGAMFFDNGNLLQVHGRDLAVAAPATMLLGVISLGHQFGYFNILPMYVLMMFIAPVFLWIGRSSPWPMVAVSFILYLLAVTRGWNLPTWPEKGTWFFDPFAWQFMMAAGMAIGLRARHAALPRSVTLSLLAAVIVAFGAFSVTDGFTLAPGFEDRIRVWAGIDKTTLGFGRILHFFSMAYLVYMLRVSDWLRRLPLFRPVSAVGRQSLTMFAVLSLMAAVGQVMMQGLGHRVMTDVVMMALGLVALCRIAWELDKRRSAPRQAALEERAPLAGRLRERGLGLEHDAEKSARVFG